MSGVLIGRRQTKSGSRYRVLYRLGGREGMPLYGGSFKAKAEAAERRKWIAGELAALRVPDVRALAVERPKSPTVTEACERWRAGRVDVSEGTRVLHRVALARCLPLLGTRRLGTAIARACRASGVPVFSPHDLRHRRVSLLHHQGRTWAEIGRFVGQRTISVTANTYTHVLSDGREVPYEELLAA